jgi:hypothetical protein
MFLVGIEVSLRPYLARKVAGDSSPELALNSAENDSKQPW